MKRAFLLSLAFICLRDMTAEVRCSGTPCADSAGGGAAFASPVATDPVDATGVWSWPAAGAANAVQINETPGCITLEGPTADGSEMRVCGGESTADHTLTVFGTASDTEIRGDAGSNISFGPAGGYRVMQIEGTAVGTVRLRTDTAVCFTGGLPEAACDTGFRRVDTGVTRAVSGAAQTTMGAFLGGMSVEAVTATKTPGQDECGEEYTNGTDSDGNAITLTDDPPLGCHFTFSITTTVLTGTFTVQPSAGESLIYGGSTCSSLTGTTRGSSIHIVATMGGSGGLWAPNGSTGTWVCVP